ncbi:TWiK family of potassium channels protein [Trichinella spiralis]|uniref:TWiK family of potassium channels protein n=1 Tax=Trichinella spiralis TaxID=6334 RepID=A0ABR3KTV8_TRISP
MVSCEAKKIFFHHYSTINRIVSKTPQSSLSYDAVKFAQIYEETIALFCCFQTKNVGMHLKRALSGCKSAAQQVVPRQLKITQAMNKQCEQNLNRSISPAIPDNQEGNVHMKRIRTAAAHRPYKNRCYRRNARQFWEDLRFLC